LHRHKTVIKACRAKRSKQKPTEHTLDNTGSSAVEASTSSDAHNPHVTAGFSSSGHITATMEAIAGANSVGMSHPVQPFSSTPARQPPQNELDELRKAQLMNRVRAVSLRRKDKKEGLGISITGGSEHGLPILVSEIHANGPAARSGALYVGDAILAANGHDLKDITHSEAVSVLTNLVSFVFFGNFSYSVSVILILI
jgi:hypothetical protein